MILYVPVYDCSYKAQSVETEKSIFRKRPGYAASVQYYGTLYCGEYLATDEKGVRAYINRNYKEMEKYRIQPSDNRIVWKQSDIKNDWEE